MKKALSVFALLLALAAGQGVFAFSGSYQVTEKDIHNGYIIEKIWLNNFATPKVSLSDVAFTPVGALPADAALSDPGKFYTKTGVERKKPFLLVYIPAYAAGSTAGQVNQLSSFSIVFEEEAPVQTKVAEKTTDTRSSVLATGTWYKIGITKTGFYKIDKAFITSLGLNAANVNPANIRIFGNGGRMLSENNAVARNSDPVENAIWVNSNGDAAFDNNEFAVFYGVGVMGWDADMTTQLFSHVKNLYTDTAFYFITFDNGAGQRISNQGSAPAGNVTVTGYNYYDVHELDQLNPAGTGKKWYGEHFNAQLNNLTQNFSFDIGSTLGCVSCKTGVAATSGASGSTFTVTVNGGAPVTTSKFSTTDENFVMNYAVVTTSGACGAQAANVGVTFTPVGSGDAGYLDYIEINARRGLVMSGDQMCFRDIASVAPGNVATYQLQGAGGSTSVWDVTNPQAPVMMNGALSGATYSFTQDAKSLHEFAAMNNTNFYSPVYEGKVINQNLHGLPQADLVIVAYDEFKTQAENLAAYHRTHDNMRVVVATTKEIYNEFSSGGQDISAIRDFIRMFYKRAGSDTTQMPSNVLLFGGASYDYKNRIANNSNFVPVFESSESSDGITSFSSDDFYAFLDDNENIEDKNQLNMMDVGVGRLPARNTDDATILVDKITGYNSAATLGPWRISTTHVADKACILVDGSYRIDGAGNHLDDAETAANAITEHGHNLYNESKVYVDGIQLTSTPAGSRAPAANAAITAQVFRGTFMINYSGHGNPTVWSSERILTQDDFNNWNNTNKLPFMLTATCDFGQFDHPQFVSAAEQLVLRKNAGVIAILTTTQAVYSSYNREINAQYIARQFKDGARNNFGTALRESKNITFATSLNTQQIANFRKFALLGDPAVTPDFPQYKISLDSTTDGYTMKRADTIKALGAYIIAGTVLDNNGSLLSGFNGRLSVSIFDKPRTVKSIDGCGLAYQVQDNIIYRGRVVVTNGKFSFTFITPKDINYNFGTGKVSCYAENGVTDAAGADTLMKIGGFSDHPVASADTPVVKPYINDTLFLNGGITGSNTSLFVSLYDKTGINVSGNEVGHDLTAVLDGNLEEPYVLNDYYETEPNTYQYGSVSFPITGLADGRHTITVKAWDVNNNCGRGTMEFMVVNGKIMDIQQLGNYPNPFATTTRFVFEHNHPYEELTVNIEIYNTSGSLVKTLHEIFTPSDSRTNELSWDGTSNGGALLPSGVYLYRLNLSTEKGFKSAAYQKLVIVR